MKPVRFQLSRAKGWRMPPNSAKCDRSTPYGNPWIPGDPGYVVLRGRNGPIRHRLPMAITLAGALDRHRRWLLGEFDGRDGALRIDHRIYDCVVCDPPPDLTPLRGLNLGCWCGLDQPCHVDATLELANREAAP